MNNAKKIELMKRYVAATEEREALDTEIHVLDQKLFFDGDAKVPFGTPVKSKGGVAAKKKAGKTRKSPPGRVVIAKKGTPLQKKLSKAMVEWRGKRKQTDVMKKTGLHSTTISALEGGRLNFTEEMVSRLSKHIAAFKDHVGVTV